MSTTSRHHIPFPSYWLSLNSPPKKLAAPNATPGRTVVMPPEEIAAHTFLSNKTTPRSASVSSASSTSSASSAPSSPPTKVVEPALVPKETSPAFQSFLSLNSKFIAPQKAVATEASPSSAAKHSFLSNRS